jgi:heme/copper-type cytochrome/quinol oxidase subunit 1
VLSMGAVFSIFAAFVHFWPLITGLTLHPIHSKSQFLILFLGVKLTFFPQHFLGLKGMPRRYCDYPDIWFASNWLSSLGSFIRILGVVYFFFIMWLSLAQLNFLLYTSTPSTHSEWLSASLPLAFHDNLILPLTQIESDYSLMGNAVVYSKKGIIQMTFYIDENGIPYHSL